MRLQGRISEWRDDRGFGFITPDAGGERVFLHVRSLARGGARPAGGERVNYRIGRDAKGRARAEQVEFVLHRRRASVNAGSSGVMDSARLVGAISYPVALAALALAGRVPLAMPLGCLVLSALTWAIYAIDKSAARAGRWRTPESILHWLALLGGWPGALLAQRQLRHKTSKTSFQLVFWCVVALNIGMVLWLLGPDGVRYLEALGMRTAAGNLG